MSKASRHQSRMCALQALFAYEIHGGALDDQLAYIAKEHGFAVPELQFASDLLKKVSAHQENIVALVTQFAPAWPISKIAPIDRVILELAIAEMKYSASDVPPVVALDEAIELAKRFGNENSAKFVNGVLNAVLNAQST